MATGQPFQFRPFRQHLLDILGRVYLEIYRRSAETVDLSSFFDFVLTSQYSGVGAPEREVIAIL